MKKWIARVILAAFVLGVAVALWPVTVVLLALGAIVAAIFGFIWVVMILAQAAFPEWAARHDLTWVPRSWL